MQVTKRGIVKAPKAPGVSRTYGCEDNDDLHVLKRGGRGVRSPADGLNLNGSRDTCFCTRYGRDLCSRIRCPKALMRAASSVVSQNLRGRKNEGYSFVY